VDGRRSLPGGALTEGGMVYAWMLETLRLEENRLKPVSGEARLSGLEAKLAQIPPDSHGLTVLPFLAGERSPGWRGDARATIHGLTLATTPLDILRAGMEAVAYRIALVYEQLRSLLPADPEIIASGGALVNSPTWGQIMADVLGRPVTLSRAEEASARGAALLALEALGILSDIAAAPDLLGAEEPRTFMLLALNEDELRPGWNLYSPPFQVTVPGGGTDLLVVWKWNAALGSYELVYPGQNLVAGEGYWILKQER
jgi:gluconokinase